MTPQEIFDFVCSKLAVQEKRAYEEDTCVYLASDRTMCAVGHILPELGLSEDQLKILQSCNGSVIKMIRNHSTLLPEWFIKNEILLYELQSVHDMTRDFSNKIDMAHKLKGLAMQSNLVFDEESFLRKAGL